MQKLQSSFRQEGLSFVLGGPLPCLAKLVECRPRLFAVLHLAVPRKLSLFLLLLRHALRAETGDKRRILICFNPS